jgi:hypothetical protein
MCKVIPLLRPRPDRDHEVDPSYQSIEDDDGRSMAGASSASVWAGLNRPVRGIVESWVRAKANPARPGFRPLGGLAGALGEVPSVGQRVRRCGHVARSAPEAARHPGTTLALRYSTNPHQ